MRIGTLSNSRITSAFITRRSVNLPRRPAMHLARGVSDAVDPAQRSPMC
jgi:hypothetical protein